MNPTLSRTLAAGSNGSAENPELVESSLRLRIATAMKQNDESTATQLAKLLKVSYEAVRKELSEMERAGLVQSTVKSAVRGRPFRKWRFTVAGEHLFPKDYDSVLGLVLKALTEPKHAETAASVLEKLALDKADALIGLSETTGDLGAVLSLYGQEDEFISVAQHGERVEITERNCPILNIARDFPMVCSVSTNALSKTLGNRVERSHKFQQGHGRCTFVVTAEKYDGEFRQESAA